jgi:hypothetical protein
VAEELASRGALGSSGGTVSATRSAPACPAAIDAGRVVTVADVLEAEGAGAALRLPAGAIVTHLAREEAERLGVALLEPGADAPRRTVRDAHDPTASGASSAEYPAGLRVAGSTAELIGRLDRYTERVWRTEPQDVGRLRQLSRPPMGRIPGIFYACFNLFWLGEETQTLRDKAKAGAIPTAVLDELLATVCRRHAVRLSKWFVVDVLELLGDVASFLEQRGTRSHDEYRELCEHLMLAADRLQSWVDRMLPWHTLDDRLELVR